MGNLEKNIAINAENRADFALIANWISPKAKVLDLGCGDGALLTKLKKTHQIHGYGVEKDDANWLKAMNNGIDVIQMDLESGLSGFEAQSFDVVINASSSSLNQGELPVPASVLSRHGMACDFMYGPASQGFMDWARYNGAEARDGLGMLVEQAAESFQLWRGVRPPTAPVLAELRALLAKS